jgi:hypothetical protein
MNSHYSSSVLSETERLHDTGASLNIQLNMSNRHEIAKTASLLRSISKSPLSQEKKKRKFQVYRFLKFWISPK